MFFAIQRLIITRNAGNYFIETKTDITGESNYTITGTSQLLSVPYALHAKTAETVTGTITETDPAVAANFDFTGVTTGDLLKFNGTKWVKVTPNYAAGTHPHPIATNVADGLQNAEGFETKVTAGTNVTITGEGTTANPYVISSGTHYLGEEYLDGIIFYLYTGSDGQQHGLIVSKTETVTQWQSVTSTTNTTRSWGGAYNMDLLTNSPAKDWVTSLGPGWYLPSIDELSVLWHNRFHANKGLNDVGATLLSNTAIYRSSTEYDAAYAFFFYFKLGFTNYSDYNNKTFTYSVLAVRAF